MKVKRGKLVRLLLAGGVITSVFVTPLLGQGTDSMRSERQRVGRAGDAKLPRRPVVEKLEARVDDLLRVRLQLNDDQFARMRAMNGRLEEERRAQRQEEGSVRRALRAELVPGVTPNEPKVAELQDKLLLLEHKRIALQEKEQKELAGFMQPSQRARFFALHDELRRSLQELQRQRAGSMGDSAASPPVLRGARGRGLPSLPR